MSTLNTYSSTYQSSKENKINNQTIVSKLMLILTFITVLTLIFTVFYSLITFSEDNQNFINHEIKRGESLWTIANKYYNAQNVDIRKVIYEIQRLNKIDSAVIRPGEKILIPLH